MIRAAATPRRRAKRRRLGPPLRAFVVTGSAVVVAVLAACAGPASPRDDLDEAQKTGAISTDCNYNASFEASLGGALAGKSLAFFEGVIRPSGKTFLVSEVVYSEFDIEVSRWLLGTEPDTFSSKAYKTGGTADNHSTVIDMASSISWSADSGRVFGLVGISNIEGLEGPSFTTWPLYDQGVIFPGTGCADSAVALASPEIRPSTFEFAFLSSSGEPAIDKCNCIPVAIDVLEAAALRYSQQLNSDLTWATFDGF